MSEIKFEAWDKDTNRMLAWLECQEVISVIGASQFFGCDEHYIKRRLVGLQDYKSGKEIHEGDIVNCRVTKFEGEPEKRAMLQLVHYDNRGNLMMGDYCAWFCYQQEIIGNQFENPELLKETT